MLKRTKAMVIALTLLLCTILAAGTALAEDVRVNFQFYYYNGGSASQLNGLFSLVVKAGTSTNINSTTVPVSHFGYQFHSTDTATVTAPAAVGVETTQTVKVYVSQMWNWYPSNYGNFPGYTGYYPYSYLNYYNGYPGYPNNGYWYNGSWYPDSYYSNAYPAWNMPDVTYTWNGTTYTIPGYLVYSWLVNGQQTPWTGTRQTQQVATVATTAPATTTTTATNITSITLSKTKYTMKRNSEFQLFASSKGQKIQANWISSNPAIAEVDSNGWVTTYDRRGKVTITAYVNGGPSRSCTITVK